MLFAILPMILFGFSDIYAEESQNLQVEVKYTNGDRADFYGMNFVVYQDQSNEIFLEKQLENNPEILLLPENHKYKIEIYANGMYAGVEYVQLDNVAKETIVNIPLSGGLKVDVYYEDGETPIEGAKVVIKSSDNTEQRQGITNSQGETLRFWIQSTTIPEDYYIADVYLGELFLTSQKSIKLQPGLTRDEKIVTDIPEIVEDLITITAFKDATTKISSSDSTHIVTMTNQFTEQSVSSEVNFRGEAQFSNLKSGTYLVQITPNEAGNWPDTQIQIVGDTDHFNIFQIPSVTENINIEETPKEVESCNCVAFRFDDVQDYWLNDVQIEFMKTFVENDIPLTLGVIANSFGDDVKMLDFVKENNFEIASHGIGNSPFTEFTKQEQDQRLKESVQLIEEKLNTTPTVFIPPQNRFNEDTKQVLIENDFTHISSSLLHGDAPPYPLTNQELYRFPETGTTGKYDPNANIFAGVIYEDTLSDTLIGLETYGFAVITSHPQEFSTVVDGTYTNEPNLTQISELKQLISEIKQRGIKIVPISEINLDSQIVVPPWIKNNAGWWADGSIDDETFVQGIEYLVKEGIITY